MPGQVPRGIRRVSGDRGTSARARCGSSAGSDKGGGRAAGALTRTVSSVGCSARGSGHMSLHQWVASWPPLAMILGYGGDDRERDAVRRCVMQSSCMLHDRVTRWRVVRHVRHNSAIPLRAAALLFLVASSALRCAVHIDARSQAAPLSSIRRVHIYATTFWSSSTR